MGGQSYVVYVLWSSLGRRFYIGLTDDVIRRLGQHNQGDSRWTKRSAGTWQLVWQRPFTSLGDARRFENLLKRQKGGSGFFKLTDLCPSAFGSSGS